MATMEFRDQAHALTFLNIIGQPAAKAKIEEDEHLFMAHAPRTVIVGTGGSVSWP